MIPKTDLLKNPNYLMTKYQLEIFQEINNYMILNNLTQKDLASKFGVSNSYISQILNGNFNFTLKKLIEIGILINKIPVLNFVNTTEYWVKKEPFHQFTLTNISINLYLNGMQKIEIGRPLIFTANSKFLKLNNTLPNAY